MSMLDEKLDQDIVSRLSKELDLGKVASVGNAYVSVDVGTTKVCTLVAQILATGEVEIIGAGKSKSRGMKKGLVVDIEAMTAAVRESIAEATLNFLGVGVPPTTPSLGTLIRLGNDFLFSGEWWITFFPAIFLVVLAFSINLLGDWMRDTLNPKLN